MAGLPQFEDENPIVQIQPIKSEAEGFEAMGEALGGTAKGLAKQAENMAEEQSNAQFLMTQVHADTLTTNAKIQLKQNPELAPKIQESYENELGTLVSQSVVNKSDRAKLRQQAASDLNSMRLQTAEVQINTNKAQAQATIYATFPEALRGIQESAGKPEFEARVQTLSDTIIHAVKAGSLTGVEGGNFLKTIYGTVNRVHEIYGLVGKKDVSAKEHNRMNYPVVGDADQNKQYPSDQNTKTIFDHHVEQKVSQDAYAAASQGIDIPFPAVAGMKENDFQHFSEYYQGAQSVNADNVTGVNVHEWQDELNKYKNQKVSAYQQGRNDRIKNMVKVLQRNEYGLVMKDDPNYKSATAEHNYTHAAIKKTPELSNRDGTLTPKGYALMRYSDNLFFEKARQAGKARHFEDSLINPIPHEEFIVPSMASFDAGGNPDILKNKIWYLNPDLRENMARMFPKPVQREVARVVGNLENAKVQDSQINSLIIANQEGVNFSSLKLGEKNEQEPAIKKSFLTLIPDVTNYINKQYRGAPERIDAMATMGMNFIKMRAIQNNDLEMKNLDVYKNEAAQLIKQAYPIEKGSTWIRNQHDLPNVNQRDLDTVSAYAIDYVKENIIAPKLGRARMSANDDANQLSVMVDPTGDLMVVSNSGQLLHSFQYSQGLLALARKTVGQHGSLYETEKKRQQEEIKRGEMTVSEMKKAH